MSHQDHTSYEKGGTFLYPEFVVNFNHILIFFSNICLLFIVYFYIIIIFLLPGI